MKFMFCTTFAHPKPYRSLEFLGENGIPLELPFLCEHAADQVKQVIPFCGRVFAWEGTAKILEDNMSAGWQVVTEGNL